jgi:hypothetical protein
MKGLIPSEPSALKNAVATYGGLVLTLSASEFMNMK